MRMMTTANILTAAPGAKLTVLCCSVQAVITCSVSVTCVPWGNIHTCVTCVNMGMCHHQGSEHLVSALLWAFDYLPCVSAFSTVCWTRLLRVTPCVTGGNCPLTLHWPLSTGHPMVTFNTGNLGAECWARAWAACDYCGSQSGLSCVRTTEAATSPMYGWHWAWTLDRSADRELNVFHLKFIKVKPSDTQIWPDLSPASFGCEGNSRWVEWGERGRRRHEWGNRGLGGPGPVMRICELCKYQPENITIIRLLYSQCECVSCSDQLIKGWHHLNCPHQDHMICLHMRHCRVLSWVVSCRCGDIWDSETFSVGGWSSHLSASALRIRICSRSIRCHSTLSNLYISAIFWQSEKYHQGCLCLLSGLVGGRGGIMYTYPLCDNKIVTWSFG